MLQRLHHVPLLTFHKCVQKQIAPVGAGGEDDPHHDAPLFPDLIKGLVLFDGEVFVVGLFQLRERGLGQIKNLPNQLVPQLWFHALDKVCHWGGPARGFVNFDVIHMLTLSYIVSVSRFKWAKKPSANSSANAGLPLIHQTGSGSVR